MPPIFTMAAITVAVSALVWGALIYIGVGRKARYLWLMVVSLPLSALVNLFIKQPLAFALRDAAGIAPPITLADPLWYLVFLALLPPLAEELVKVTPLLLPTTRALFASRTGALWTGFALGVGFGIGEAMYVAWNIAASDAFVGVPWYQFTGFFGERLMLTFAHGVMTAVFVSGLQLRGRFVWVGALGAIVLHLLLTIGTVFFQLGATTQQVGNLVTQVMVIGLVLVFIVLRQRAHAVDETA